MNKATDKASRFVCAMRLYSHVLKDSVWIVLNYPFGADIEESYPVTKASLGLQQRPKGTWKIWPYPFCAPDGKAAFYLPMGLKQ